MTKIKICGIKNFQDIEYVNTARPDYIGFVFAKSKRQVDFSKAHMLKKELHNDIKSVGVFVNENIDFIKKLCDYGIIDYIQLHGDEGIDFIKSLKLTTDKPIIKAVRIKDKINCIYNDADYFLFDTYRNGVYGGTGEKFDWNIIKDFDKPFFLAGGLNEYNIIEAIDIVHPYCLDVSSGVETDGIKDRQKIINIVNLIRSI